MMIHRAVLVIVALAPSRAHADGPCEVLSQVARDAGDPSLAPPTEAAAVAAMRRGVTHHTRARKLLGLVATRDEAGAEFRSAIGAYVEAAMHSPAPSILFNLAQVYRESADYPSAIEQYRSFLARANPRPPLRALVECHITSMSAELDRAAASAPPTGPTPTAIGPQPAAHATPREASRLESPPPVIPSDGWQPSRAPGQDAPGVSNPETSPVPWHADVTGWAVAGTGVAAAGVGVYLLLDARDARAQAKREQGDDERRALDDKAESRARWGTIVTVAGGVVAGLGAFKLALTPSRPANGLALRVGRGFSIEGRF